MNLRQYQQEAVAVLFNAIKAGKRDLLLESPVGSGKTSEVKALAAGLLAAPGHRLVVILVPQNLLKEQWAAAGEWSFDRHTVRLGLGSIIERVADLTPGFWRNHHGLMIVTRQALTRIGTTLDKLGAKALAGVLVVADEGHHCALTNASGRALETMRAKGAATLLVSATPWSSSGDIGGPETVAHRLSPASYVTAFEPGDASRPPSEWVVERVFVGAAVDDAEATIDRSGSGPAAKRSAAPKGAEAARAKDVCEAIAARWAKDGFPRVVINVPRQFWREPLLKALRAAWRKAGKAGAPDVLDLVGDMTDDELAAAQARLKADSNAARWADIKIDAVISCARMDEGTDWVPCSHVYNAGIPRVAGLIIQRWGRASRPKGRIKGYPKKWQDKQTLVFFTPPVSEAGVEGAWKAHRESSWLLAGYLADFRTAKEWAQDRVRRGLSTELPVPAGSPAVAKLQGKLAEEVERRGGEMPEADARAWLAKLTPKPAPEDVDAAVRRMQMADERARKAEEKREAALLAGGGLEIKWERRPEAEPLVEAFAAPIRSADCAREAIKFTAMDAVQVAERMRDMTVGYQWPHTRDGLLAFAQEHGRRYFAAHGKWPSCASGVIDGCDDAKWGSLDKALARHGTSLAAALGRPSGPRGRAERRAAELQKFFQEHGRWPGRRAEPALSTAMHKLRCSHPDLAKSIGLRPKVVATRTGKMSAKERLRWGVVYFKENGRWPSQNTLDGKAFDNARRRDPETAMALGIPIPSDGNRTAKAQNSKETKGPA